MPSNFFQRNEPSYFELLSTIETQLQNLSHITFTIFTLEDGWDSGDDGVDTALWYLSIIQKHTDAYEILQSKSSLTPLLGFNKLLSIESIFKNTQSFFNRCLDELRANNFRNYDLQQIEAAFATSYDAAIEAIKIINITIETYIQKIIQDKIAIQGTIINLADLKSSNLAEQGQIPTLRQLCIEKLRPDLIKRLNVAHDLHVKNYLMTKQPTQTNCCSIQ